jgi:hypothetical protein
MPILTLRNILFKIIVNKKIHIVVLNKKIYNTYYKSIIIIYSGGAVWKMYLHIIGYQVLQGRQNR